MTVGGNFIETEPVLVEDLERLAALAGMAGEDPLPVGLGADQDVAAGERAAAERVEDPAQLRTVRPDRLFAELVDPLTVADGIDLIGHRRSPLRCLGRRLSSG